MLIWMLWALLAASCWGQALGTWKMIPAKSRHSGGPLAKQITAQYQAHSKTEIWTFYQVRAGVTPGDVHWVQGTGLPNAFKRRDR